MPVQRHVQRAQNGDVFGDGEPLRLARFDDPDSVVVQIGVDCQGFRLLTQFLAQIAKVNLPGGVPDTAVGSLAFQQVLTSVARASIR